MCLPIYIYIYIIFFRAELSSVIDGTNAELVDVKQALESYKMVGSEFDDLVLEYTYLQEEICNKEQLLKTLTANAEEGNDTFG